MTTPPMDGCPDGHDGTIPGQGCVLTLQGGPGLFLQEGGVEEPSVLGGPVGPRFLKAQDVVQSDIWLRTGLLRPLRATQLAWSARPERGEFGFIAQRLIMSN